MEPPKTFLPPGGGYEGLSVYKKATVIYDITFFCKDHSASSDFMKDMERRSDEAIANIVITLLHQFDSMMGSLIARLEKDFVAKGGIREKMTAARLGYRNQQEDEIRRLAEENRQLTEENRQLRALVTQLQQQLRE